MKKEFTTANGSQGMIIDCDEYEVEIFKSIDKEYYGSHIKYINKKNRNVKVIAAAFVIDWDEGNLGGRLEIKYRDRWGSQMNFIHYFPSDLRGMFDFIGRGYNIFDEKFYGDDIAVNE